MPKPAGPSRAPLFWIIALGGLVAVVLVLGLGWGLVWLLGLCAYGLSRISMALGVAFGIAAAALVAAPPILDQRVLDAQIAAIEAHEVSMPPIDLTGAHVLFVGGSRYTPHDCSDLCRAVAEFSPADAVYFGHGRSLDLRFGDGPVDLLDRVIHTFAEPLIPGLPADTPSVPAIPERIDYVVMDHASLAPRAEAEILPDVPTYGVFPTNTLWMEYIVFEAGDLTAFDPVALTPLVTRFEYSRHSHVFGGLPFTPLGDIDFSHAHDPGLSWRVSANTREVGAILCGPEGRPDYRDCAVVVE
ncbi:hypothetical protein [Hasllibacter sp. MH4015]|uniref:hypothetical protein n=1 Tax=Hasllibacter sp. MH4015 TaxID=2854029 RepID=UPI001CD27CAB|nr:hypothetical protein [Hasllibacter sp. MH4015]